MVPILPLLASINSKYYVAIALSAVIGVMGLRIWWLKGKVGRLEGQSLRAKTELSIARDTNKLNGVATRELQERLEECSIANRKLEALGEDAVTKLERELQHAEESTKKALNSVTEALEGESCASTPIPRDVERELRKAASRANGDS